MMQERSVELTEAVTADINKSSGSDYSLDDLQANVNECFGLVDFDNSMCQQCHIQVICSVYRGRRYGTDEASLRARFVTGKMGTVSPELREAILTAQAQLLQKTPSIVMPEPVLTPLTAIEATPAPEVVPVPTQGSQGLLPFVAPPPEEIVPYSNGTAPTGWPDLEREHLVQIAFSLGYSEEDCKHKRAKKLVSMIEEKKPEWHVAGPGDLPEPMDTAAAMPVVAPPEPVGAGLPPVFARSAPSVEASLVLPSPASAGNGKISPHVTRVDLRGPAEEIARWLASEFGKGSVTVIVERGS